MLDAALSQNPVFFFRFQLKDVENLENVLGTF
jgi:hypothetical protein